MKNLWFIILSCLIPMGVKAGYPFPVYSHYTGAERTNFMSLYPGVGNPFHELFAESIWNQTVKNGGNVTQKFAEEVISYYHHMVDAKNKTEFTVPIEPRPEDEDCRCGLKENFEPTNGLKLGNLTYANMPWVVHVMGTLHGRLRYKCVGTLIDRRHVLTTIRCVNTHLMINFEKETKFNDELVSVNLVNHFDEDGNQAYINISEIIVYTHYKHGYVS
jgi:hypothetical protein